MKRHATEKSTELLSLCSTHAAIAQGESQKNSSIGGQGQTVELVYPATKVKLALKVWCIWAKAVPPAKTYKEQGGKGIVVFTTSFEKPSGTRKVSEYQ